MKKAEAPAYCVLLHNLTNGENDARAIYNFGAKTFIQGLCRLTASLYCTVQKTTTFRIMR